MSCITFWGYLLRGERMGSHMVFCAYVERACRIGNLFEMKENMITPKRVVDTHLIPSVRSISIFALPARSMCHQFSCQDAKAMPSSLSLSLSLCVDGVSRNGTGIGGKSLRRLLILNSNLCALNVNIESFFLLFACKRNPIRMSVGRCSKS